MLWSIVPSVDAVSGFLRLAYSARNATSGCALLVIPQSHLVLSVAILSVVSGPFRFGEGQFFKFGASSKAAGKHHNRVFKVKMTLRQSTLCCCDVLDEYCKNVHVCAIRECKVSAICDGGSRSRKFIQEHRGNALIKYVTTSFLNDVLLCIFSSLCSLLYSIGGWCF
mmetsp:Transcript_47296/g.74761  ORF Transcript_47296/g.74761 Transcript_47296/m.74761 type:complete len:167 (+) Transcript_47296:76-576(+)